MACVINPCVQGISIREYLCTKEYVELGYLRVKIQRDSRGDSRPACVQTPFLLLELIKNIPGSFINCTRLGETSVKPNPPLTLERFFIYIRR